MSRLHALLPLAALVFLPALPTQALDAAAWCPPEEVAVEPDRHLRNLSLDLRGVVPTLDDYGVVEDAGEVPDWLLDEWLGSE